MFCENWSHRCIDLTKSSFLQMRSVDRVFKFIDLPSEEMPVGNSGGTQGSDLIIDNPHAQIYWPNRGQMDVKGLTVKYTETGHPVLSNISFSVEGGQSVSVCEAAWREDHANICLIKKKTKKKLS